MTTEAMAAVPPSTNEELPEEKKAREARDALAAAEGALSNAEAAYHRDRSDKRWAAVEKAQGERDRADTIARRSVLDAKAAREAHEANRRETLRKRLDELIRITSPADLMPDLVPLVARIVRLEIETAEAIAALAAKGEEQAGRVKEAQRIMEHLGERREGVHAARNGHQYDPQSVLYLAGLALYASREKRRLPASDLEGRHQGIVSQSNRTMREAPAMRAWLESVLRAAESK